MESSQLYRTGQNFMQPRALLTPAVALMFVFLSGCEQELSASRSNHSGKTKGESWICATVGDADFDSWQPVGPIEGLTLHFEAQMVLEREVYEKGFFQYLVRSNVGPIFLKKKSGEVLLLSTGHSPPLPSGSGEWGMIERAVADADALDMREIRRWTSSILASILAISRWMSRTWFSSGL